jgi:hypothetical protein
MSVLSKLFERIAIISLPDRTDRRERLLAHLLESNLANSEDITWVDAVDGRKQKLPDWWKAGPGAWGCRASHWKTIAAAQRDCVERLLILEDDVVFHPRAAEWLPQVAALLPVDWDLFFLGGQHLQHPAPTEHPRLVKGKYITRTHAWAIQRRAYGRLLAEIGNDAVYRRRAGSHVDHQLGAGQSEGLWAAYAPTWWLAGQDEGASNISGHQDRRRWWQWTGEYWRLPFITGMDAQTHAAHLCTPEAPPPTDRLALALWLRDAAREAWHQGRLPACALPAEKIIPLWPGGVRCPDTAEELAHLADYPANGLFPHAFSPNNHTTKTIS